MEVGRRLLVLRLLFKLLMSSRFFAFSANIYTNKPTNQCLCSPPTWVFPLSGLHPSPDSASLSDSLSSSELELLEALAWPGATVWMASSSSSSVGPLGSGGCLSRSCRQIFSLLLIREIEVLRGRGQGRVEEQQQVTCKGRGELISEDAHSTCSQLELACNTSKGRCGEGWGSLPVLLQVRMCLGVRGFQQFVHLLVKCFKRLPYLTKMLIDRGSARTGTISIT